MKEERVEFKNSKGLNLVGVLHIPDGTGPFPVVVIAHGMGSGKKGTAEKLAVLLCENGFVALRFDMTGHGESGGKPTDRTPLTAVDDVSSALDLVETLDYVDKDKIGLLGSSYGGNAALFVAANDNRIKVLGLKEPVSNYQETRELQLGKDGIEEWKQKKVVKIKGKHTLSYKFYEDSKQTVIYPLAKKITAPTLIVHGSADKTVPVEQSRKTFELMECEKSLEILEGADHSFKHHPEHYEKCIKLLIEWFKRWLK